MFSAADWREQRHLVCEHSLSAVKEHAVRDKQYFAATAMQTNCKLRRLSSVRLWKCWPLQDTETILIADEAVRVDGQVSQSRFNTGGRLPPHRPRSFKIVLRT